MNIKNKNTHPLNKLFLTKLQQHIKQSPGYEEIDFSNLDLLAKLVNNPAYNHRYIKR